MLEFPFYSLITHIATFFSILVIAFQGQYKWTMSITSVLLISFIVSLFSLTDYEIYAEIYKSFNPNISFIIQLPFLYGEVGYLYINYLIRAFTDNFNYLRYFFVLIPLIIKVLFLFRFGGFFPVSFILYISTLFYPDSYLLRSTMASGFVLIAIIGMIENKSGFYFILFIVLASLIHTSALITLPIWFFKKVELSKAKAFFLFGMIVAVGFIGMGHFLENVISIYFSSEFYIVNELSTYSNSIHGESTGMLRFSTILYSSIVLVFINYKNIISKQLKNYNLILAICLYSLLILLGFSDFGVLADRLFRIICIFPCIALGHIVFCVNINEKPMIITVLLVSLNLLPYLSTPWVINFIN